MSVLEIVLLIVGVCVVITYLCFGIYDVKHPERKKAREERKKAKKLEKQKKKEQNNDTDEYE